MLTRASSKSGKERHGDGCIKRLKSYPHDQPETQKHQRSGRPTKTASARRASREADMDALGIRTQRYHVTLSLCGHGCSGNTDVIIVRTWMLWEHGLCHRADMDALVTRTLSSCGHGCSGNTDVIIVQTCMLW